MIYARHLYKTSINRVLAPAEKLARAVARRRQMNDGAGPVRDLET